MAKEISVKDEIRNYVRLNNNSVTCQEVITYILEEKKIKKTPASIRKTLWEVLKETGGTLKPYTKSYNLKEEIRNYVIAHNNYVTSKEVITYILEEKKIQETEKNIRGILSIVLKETGGKLKNRIKHYGLTAEIRNGFRSSF